jgi:hypothetical protein
MSVVAIYQTSKPHELAREINLRDCGVKISRRHADRLIEAVQGPTRKSPIKPKPDSDIVSEPDIEIVDKTFKPDASNPPLWEAWGKSDQSAQREFVEVHWCELEPFIKAELKGDRELLERQNDILCQEVADLRRELKEIEESEIGELKLENDALRRKLEALKPPGRCGWVRNDGGRRASGHKVKGDCVIRAIAIATGKPYGEVFGALKGEAARYAQKYPRSWVAGEIKRSRKGAYNYKQAYEPYLKSLGWQYTSTKGLRLRADQLPPGRLVVMINRHAVAVIDGVIHDLYDSGGAGKVRVEGYYTKVVAADAA